MLAAKFFYTAPPLVFNYDIRFFGPKVFLKLPSPPIQSNFEGGANTDNVLRFCFVHVPKHFKIVST